MLSLLLRGGWTGDLGVDNVIGAWKEAYNEQFAYLHQYGKPKQVDDCHYGTQPALSYNVIQSDPLKYCPKVDFLILVGKVELYPENQWWQTVNNISHNSSNVVHSAWSDTPI